jgi:hypothetical protein
MSLSYRFFTKIALSLLFLALYLSDIHGVTGASRDKVYVARERVIVRDETLLLEVNGKEIPIEAVYRDQKGFYVAPDSFYHPGKAWYCLNCAELNSGWASFCSKCRGGE